jgi:hypothetical protein
MFCFRLISSCNFSSGELCLHFIRDHVETRSDSIRHLMLSTDIRPWLFESMFRAFFQNSIKSTISNKSFDSLPPTPSPSSSTKALVTVLPQHVRGKVCSGDQSHYTVSQDPLNNASSSFL